MLRSYPRLVVATFIFMLGSAPALAVADYREGPPRRDPGYGPYQDEEGFFLRRGLVAGLGLGIGALSTDSGILDCVGCRYRPAAGGFNAHLGGMIDHRTALVGEYWVQVQALDDFGDAYGVQHMLMGAVQYWLAPQLWLKGGLGLAALQISYYDGFVDEVSRGGSIMAAIGYDIISAPDFTLDLQLRVGSGIYRRVSDRASTGMVGVSVSWY